MNRIWIASLVALAAVAGVAFAEINADAVKAFEAAHHKMMASMGVKLSGDPDRDFVLMMIPHHEGAIDMAKIELQYGKDPMLRELAQKIVDAQETEIAEMKEWQKKHGM
jgi:uncharacterized protein (DUF305 family)